LKLGNDIKVHNSNETIAVVSKLKEVKEEEPAKEEPDEAKS
jgi:hypothetical protein